jgi:hypothetical protein
VLWCYRALASLKLAVVLISASAVVLAWATFVEREYGTKAVHFGIYGTWWFAGLVFLLGLNVLCAAAIRFPWKKYQTGFVITHAGILVLLSGCWLSWLGGIDAQMPIFEQTAARRAFVDTQHFELAVYGSAPESGIDATPEMIRIPFVAGPFNWNDYERLSWFPWRLSRRDRGVVYDRDGVRLEVLDYLSDSKSAAVPPLKLQVRTRAGKQPAAPADAKASPASPPAPAPQGTAAGPEAWQSVELSIQDASNPQASHRRMGLGARQQLPSGQQIVFWVAGSQAETDAFLNSRPEGPLGSKGQIVLYVGGKRHVFPLDSFAPGSRVPLGDTGLQVELVELDSRFWGVSLRVIAPGEKPQRLMLLADYPEFSLQDKEHGIIGTYWREGGPAPASEAGPPEPGALRGIGRPRIDVVQGVDGQLYYRAWKSPQVEALAPLPRDGTPCVAFAGSQEQLTWRVEEFTPHDRPGETVQAVPFSAKKESNRKVRRALVELTVDESSERFWLDGLEMNQFEFPPRDHQRKVVYGNGRRAAVMLANDEITVGFRVRLLNFNRKLDPGTSMASHYSSKVTFLADDGKPPDPNDFGKDDDTEVLRKDVLITLNEPVSFSDPRSRRSYRLFQESFAGPWRPGDEQFDQIVPAGNPLDQLFVSFLTVNYDPGRGLKYTGSLLIVAGVGIVFYMRAYFFRRRGRK